jgi:hypothetical protein
MARQLLAAHPDRFLRPLASISEGLPDLPDPNAPTPPPNNSVKPTSMR